MDLYIYRSYGGKAGDRTEKNLLIERASLTYADMLPDFGRLLRTPEGKPYFENKEAPYFSVSHTGSLWACLFADRPIGMDLQQKTKADWLKLAERFFTPEEKDYVRIFGEEGFFKIWVRKEAYVKCIGSTLARELSKASMVRDGILLEKLSFKDGDFFMGEIPEHMLLGEMEKESSPQLYGAYCLRDDSYTEKSGAVKDIWVNILT